MSKTKKSKLLASMLCATVLAGLYAGPVMAGDGSTSATKGSGISINIQTDGTPGGEGLYVYNWGGGTQAGFQLGGQINISTDNLVSALYNSSLTLDTVTIGGQAINATTIGEFKDDYSALKDKVAALDPTDLTSRVNTLETNTAGISREGNTTKISGNLSLNGSVTANSNIITTSGFKVRSGSGYAFNADASGITVGNVPGPGQEVYFKVDASNGNVETRGTVTATEDVVANGTSLVNVGAGLDKATNDIATLRTDTNTLRTDVNTVDTIARNNEKNINTITGDVATLRNDTNTLRTDVTNLDGKVNVIENNTTDISYDKGVTTIAETAKFGKGYMQVGSTILAKDGSIGAANGKFTVTPDGEVIVSGENGSTNINGNGITVGDTAITNGVITTHKADIGGVEIANGRVDGVDVSELSGSVFDNSKDITELERKTTGIEYANGTTTVGGVDFKEGAITAANGKFTVDQYGVASANVLKAHSVLFDGGSISATGISAVNGKFVVHEDGSVKSFGDVQSENYSLEEIGKNLGDLETGVSADLNDLKQKTSTLTVIEGTSKGTITNISSHLNVQGDISANGDVTTKAGASLNGLNEQVKEDALKIHNLQVNTAGITRDGEVTTIEGATSFDADGMKMVGDNITDHVTINRNGSMEARNGDASFYFDKNSIALNNGNNSVMVGNESITLSTTGAALTMSKDGLDYADGAFKVAADGSVRIAGGTENSITLDAKTGVIYANDFSTGEYSLNAIGDQLTELETGVSETNKNVAGITRKDEVTTIEGATSFDANGMKVGNNVTINKDGSMEARNGDASMYFNDGNISLNNGTNSVMVGNNSITLDADGTALTMNHDGLDYADGAFTVRNDGTVYANGSMTADDFITKDGIKLSEVNDKLGDLEGSVGETNKNVAGIRREEVNGDYVTVIEDYMRISNKGVSLDADKFGFTYTTSDGSIGVGNLGDLANKVNEIDDRLDVVEDKTQNINGSGEIGKPGEGGNQIEVPPTTDGETGINGDATVGGDLTVGGSVTAGEGNFSDKVTVGGENGTSIDKDGVNVGGENGTSITDKDVVINQGTDNEVSLSDVGNRVDNLEQGMASMSNRISKVEDRIDKVGAMSAAIANLRTMGYDPTAPTEIAVGIGQYRSETGAALGLFHYPNKDFMLSLSVSTSGDEVMGGIGATWKFGRKSPEQMLAAEKEKAAKAKLAKAEAMKKAAAEAKVAEQQAKHAKMAAEKAAK